MNVATHYIRRKELPRGKPETVTQLRKRTIETEASRLMYVCRNNDIVSLVQERTELARRFTTASLISIVSVLRKKLGIAKWSDQDYVHALMDEGWSQRDIIRHTRIHMATIYTEGRKWRKTNEK